jgi:hypothetical protein
MKILRKLLKIYNDIMSKSELFELKFNILK